MDSNDTPPKRTGFPWVDEFGPEFLVPPIVGESAGEFADQSWGNDICPSFDCGETKDGQTISLWCDHPNPEEREMPEWKRFRVVVDDGKGLVEDVFETDDINEAVAKVRELRKPEVAP
jgi:hypothetical protein